MFDKMWTVGFKDRGHGSGDFAVIVAGTEELVVEAPSLEVAEHIVEAHNFKLDSSNADKSSEFGAESRITADYLRNP